MIRLATIGTSTITEKLAAAARDTDGIEIAAVHSRTMAGAQRFAQRIGAPAAWDDLPALYASGTVDAVYIASPNGVHAGQARAALEAGLSVLIEKPAATTAAAFDELTQLAAARGLVVLEAMRNVYDPGMAAVADLIPRIGPVRLISLSQCQRSARYDLVLAGEVPAIFDPALGGGALADLGCYPLAALVHLFGEPQAVSGQLVSVVTGADGAGAALLTYPGAIAHIAFSKISASAVPNEIQGEDGTITIDEITAPRHLTLTPTHGDVEHIVIDAPTANMRYELERFVQVITGGDSALPDTARTSTVLRLSDAIRAAACSA